MDELKKKTEEAAELFLNKVIVLLEGEKITLGDARDTAHAFLDLQPFVSIDDLNAKMKLFGETHTDFKLIFETMAAATDASETKRIIDQIKTIIKESGPTAALKSIGA